MSILDFLVYSPAFPGRISVEIVEQGPNALILPQMVFGYELFNNRGERDLTSVVVTAAPEDRKNR